MMNYGDFKIGTRFRYKGKPCVCIDLGANSCDIFAISLEGVPAEKMEEFLSRDRDASDADIVIDGDSEAQLMDCDKA